MPQKTWFLFADEGKARLFESAGAIDGWRHLRTWENSSARLHEQELRSAPLTKGQTIGSGSRYAVEEAHLRASAADEFVSELSGFINASAAANKFDRIVLAAPAKTLGALRTHFHKTVEARGLTEWTKDLTNMPEGKLLVYCRSELGSW